MKAFTLTASILYVAAVLFLCFASSVFFENLNEELPQFFLSVRIDHWVHFLMFLPFPFFFFLVVKCFLDGTALSGCTAISAVICGLLFAAFTEIVQASLISTREGELSDFIADACGILVCSVFVAAAGKKILELFNRIFN